MAGKAKDALAMAGDGASDAFAELIDASRRNHPKPEFGGGALDRRSISEQVANRVMAMIKSGNLKSGDRLPTEAQMGIAFGISRPPLREALKALTLMGVLESRQGGRMRKVAVRTVMPCQGNSWTNRRRRSPSATASAAAISAARRRTRRKARLTVAQPAPNWRSRYLCFASAMMPINATIAATPTNRPAAAPR